MHDTRRRIIKALDACRWRHDFRALRFGVAASSEHRAFLRNETPLRTILDIGANRGQFILETCKWHPLATTYAFEPHVASRNTLKAALSGVSSLHVLPYALGETNGSVDLHVLPDAASSSLLHPAPLQLKRTPGWRNGPATKNERVEVRRLDNILNAEQLEPPVLCKIDVQGYELQAINGFGLLLSRIDTLLVELSFESFYVGNSPATACISTLLANGLRLTGIHDIYSPNGSCLQADFVFSRQS